MTSGGQLYAFGDNFGGQLGSATNNGTSNPNPTPTVVSLPGQSGQVTQIAAGAQHTLVLTSSGQLYAFGLNDNGQLGIATNSGTSNPTPTPAIVSLPGQNGVVTEIAGGLSHSLVVTASGQLYAFGDNSDGQLGTATNSGTANANPTPTLVSLPAGETIDTVAKGPVAQYSLALVSGLALTTSSLPAGRVGSPYGTTLTATGGTPPVSWTASGLGAGLALDPSSGIMSGTPTMAGSFTITATATDRYGGQATSTLRLTILPTSPSPTSATQLSGLRVSPSRFLLAGRKVGGRCVTPIKKTNRHVHCRRAISLRVSYALSGTATVMFTIELRAAGREVAGHCVKPTSRNANRRSCKRLTTVGHKIINSGKAGANQFTFNGKIGGHTLGPGTYELTATPTGGQPDKTAFEIVP